ncbi:sodium/substrate symporter small subunit [Bacteroidota bacterium]
MTDHEKYQVNFFKPLSNHAKANTKLILTLAIIWAVGVFGFQILLMILNNPTPEAAYTKFESVWPAAVEDVDSGIEAKQELSKVLLSVLGKNIAVSDVDKASLKNTLSWTVYSMLPDSSKGVMSAAPEDEAVVLAKTAIGLEETGFEQIMINLLPTSLVAVQSDKLDEKYKNAIPGIMVLYLVHNQNAFTDFKFLGFPFHYWYTAQFLLIMFVVLCLIYATAIDRMNKKHDFVEET